MEKGVETREKILNAAMHMVRENGLDSLTIGETAKQVGMSKSGVFAHFESRDELLLNVIEFTAQDFKVQVFDRAMQHNRGLERIHALSRYWLRWSNQPSGGCPFMSGAFEFDDRPGVIRDALVKHEKSVHDIWERAAKIAVEEKEFKEDADCKQFAYEVFGNILSFHIYKRLLNDVKAGQLYNVCFQNIISRHLK
ncbi:MAG TPA: TetR/AcrR family transcriptional regulator [Gallionellaceae bacterium]|nr:TetR/AcrR family transcriptional regulator [Gallionellaceae bacterium]